MNVYPRCVGVCRDNTQCGRRVVDGSNPPLCHIHAKGSPSPIIPPPDEVDELKILKRLAKDANPQIRLRAVDLLMGLKKHEGCAECSARSERVGRTNDSLDRCTQAQLEELRGLMAQVNAIKATAAKQPLREEL